MIALNMNPGSLKEEFEFVKSAIHNQTIDFSRKQSVKRVTFNREAEDSDNNLEDTFLVKQVNSNTSYSSSKNAPGKGSDQSQDFAGMFEKKEREYGIGVPILGVVFIARGWVFGKYIVPS